MEPQPLLPGGPPHAVELPLLVEAPAPPDALAHRVAEDPPRGRRLALVARGQHEEVGRPHAAVLHDRAFRPEALDVGMLDQADAPVDDHLRAAGVEVVPTAAALVHDLPAGVVLPEG